MLMVSIVTHHDIHVSGNWLTVDENAKIHLHDREVLWRQQQAIKSVPPNALHAHRPDKPTKVELVTPQEGFGDKLNCWKSWGHVRI